MDGFKEKKWFVYLGDHHEGPFSLEDIQEKMSHGQLSATNYVWAEGMADWLMMNEVKEFDSILHVPPPMSKEPPSLQAVGDISLMTSSMELSTAGPSIHLEATPAVKASPQIVLLETPAHNRIVNPDAKKSQPKKSRPFVKWILFLLLCGGAGYAYVGGYFNQALENPSVKNGILQINGMLDPLLVMLSEKVPMLGEWISPIPVLQDVEKQEFEELRNAAKTPIDSTGPALAIGLSRADLFNPTFYVSSNLPDGAIFDVYVEGISDTLLNQLSFFGKGQIVISKRLGQTSALKGLDGRPFQRGQYMVYVVDPQTQPAPVQPYLSKLAPVTPSLAPAAVPKGLKVVAFKTYFLGGLKDASYTARLKEFHDKLNAKAQAELSECKQYAATLEMQLSSTTSKFASVHRGKKISPSQKKSWADFDKQWSSLLDQMNQVLSKITPESLKTDYLYGTIYQESQQATQAVANLHTIQNAWVNGTGDPKSFEIQAGEAVAVAQNAVNELKAKIDSIEKLPPKPNGMPNRDGT